MKRINLFVLLILATAGFMASCTDDDFAKAEKVAAVLQECVDYADGDSNVFTDELKRRIN